MAKKENQLSSLALFSDDAPPAPLKQEEKTEEKTEEKAEEKTEEKTEGKREESLVPTDEEIEARRKAAGGEKPKDKGSQFAELRARKDELEEENAKLKKQLEEGGGTYKPPEELADTFSAFKDEDDPVVALANAHKATREENEALKKQVEEQTGKLRNYDINNDPQFQDKYVKPFNSAQESLKLDLFKVDGTGKLVHPDKFGGLYQSLLDQVSKDGRVDGTKVKAAMVSFKTEYERETGETWEMPRPQNVVDGLRTMVSAYTDMQEGQKNFEQERVKLKEEAEIAQQREAEEKSRHQEAIRRNQTTEYIDGFAFDDYKDLGTEKEIRAKFESAFSKANGFLTDPSSVPTFPEMVRNFMFLEQFENIRKENAEMKKRLEELDDDGVGAGSSEGHQRAKPKEGEQVSAYGLFEG